MWSTALASSKPSNNTAPKQSTHKNASSSLLNRSKPNVKKPCKPNYSKSINKKNNPSAFNNTTLSTTVMFNDLSTDYETIGSLMLNKSYKTILKNHKFHGGILIFHLHCIQEVKCKNISKL